MFAKVVLPQLGGAPSVWNGCLVFYQATLLLGYLYAHLSYRWLGPKKQAVLHLAMLALAWIFIPLHFVDGILPSVTIFPVGWLWLLLAASVGLPFLVVSASAPMLQAWYGSLQSPARNDPYFLYSASNLGSLLALLAYPLAIEPRFNLAQQNARWAVGYGVLMALVAACAAGLWRRSFSFSGTGEGIPTDFITVRGADVAGPVRCQRLRWMALSAVPSALLLGVTTHVTSDVAPIPLLWVVPLALYMLSFVLVFAPREIIPLRWMVRLEPYTIVAATVALLGSAAGPREVVLLGTLHLSAFFAIAMVCHGQLAADRPATVRLTEFYLWISLGGVLGGLFCTLVAPIIFSGITEYPLMLVAACLCRPRSVAVERPFTLRANLLPFAAMTICFFVAWGLRAENFLSGLRFTDTPAMRMAIVCTAAITALLLRKRPAVFAVSVAALAVISLWSVDTGTRVLISERSFFGVLRVDYDSVWNMHQLRHGSTFHGQQSLDDRLRLEPWGYYHRTGPLGQIFDTFRSRRPHGDIGVLGLGAGTIAAYALPGDRMTFYEIDPAMERLARDTGCFTYMADCRGQTEVILGDARLSLEHGPKSSFDLLIIDVFSSDSVPVHLLTREAFQVYRDKLNDRGILAIHISSRYLDLEPIVGSLAEDAGLTARIWHDMRETGAVGRVPSIWVALSAAVADLGAIAADRHWRSLQRNSGPVWSDDFSNVASTVNWNVTGLRLLPWAWKKSNKADDHISLAMALIDEGKIDQAIAHFEQALQLDPSSADIHYSLGVALATRGRTDDAISHYEEALTIDPNHAAAHYNLGVSLRRQGKTEAAINQYRQAILIKPDYFEALANLGSALSASNRYDDAAACYRRALELKPDSAEVLYNLGITFEKQGRVAEAKSQWVLALERATATGDAKLAETVRVQLKRIE